MAEAEAMHCPHMRRRDCFVASLLATTRRND
jgi:hypothetical protein